MEWIQKEWLADLSSESQCPTTPASLPHRRRQEQRRESVSMHMLLWCLMNHFAWGWGTGTHSSWGGVCSAEMYEGGAHHRWRQQPPCHLWLEQVRGESGMANVHFVPLLLYFAYRYISIARNDTETPVVKYYWQRHQCWILVLQWHLKWHFFCVSLNWEVTLGKHLKMTVWIGLLWWVSWLLVCCAGKQVSQVSGLHVESIVLGYGGCCIDGYCVGQWTGKLTYFLLLLSAFFNPFACLFS